MISLVLNSGILKPFQDNMFSEIDRLLRVQIKQEKTTLRLSYRECQSSCELDPTFDVRWFATQIAFGFKLHVDRITDPYDVKMERKQTQKARNVYEVASPYGTRIPMLISATALHFFDLQSKEKAFRVSCHGNQDYYFVFREDVRRGIHILTEEDFEDLPYDEKNIVSAANYALFYERHKGQTQENRLSFTSSDFRISGILTLFPDMIFDLAASHAFAFVASPNEVVVLCDTTKEAAVDELQKRLKVSALPWCTLLFEFKDGRLIT